MLDRICAAWLVVVVAGCSGEKPAPQPEPQAKKESAATIARSARYEGGTLQILDQKERERQKATDEMWNGFTAKMNADDSATK